MNEYVCQNIRYFIALEFLPFGFAGRQLSIVFGLIIMPCFLTLTLPLLLLFLPVTFSQFPVYTHP